WGLIFAMYTDDRNGRFFSRDAESSGCWWMDPLRLYHRDNKQLLFCPEAAEPYAEGDDSTFAAWSVGDDSGSYGLNAWLCDPGRQETTSVSQLPIDNYWKTVSRIRPHNIPMLLDAAWFAGRPQHTDNPTHNPGGSMENNPLSEGGMDCFCIDRHTGYSNALFMDWSVRKVGIKELWTLKWHREFDTQGPWTRAGGVQPSDWPPWMRNFRDY
ncbi:MAG: hypothetical protein ACYTEK_26285, partial [Planctomycetota bacterium]